MPGFYKVVGGLLCMLSLSIIVACSSKSELMPATVVDAEPPPATESAPTTNPDPETTARLAVGEKAPSFRLADQHGNERSLDELLAKNKVALVFFRSADW